MTYTSSRKANTCSPGCNCCLTSARASWSPRLKSSGISGSPCSPPSACSMTRRCPSASSHAY
eukprot:7751135-Karenia_brevis.AAC.1